MEQIPNNSAAARAISLEELRAALKGEPPVGAEVARACRFDVLELARLCGCSLRQLQRVFGEARRTPHHWLREHQMLSALSVMTRMHAMGELQIKRLASEMGYRHSHHFARQFRRIFGLTPIEFLGEREKALRSLGVGRTIAV